MNLQDWVLKKKTMNQTQRKFLIENISKKVNKKIALKKGETLFDSKIKSLTS